MTVLKEYLEMIRGFRVDHKVKPFDLKYHGFEDLVLKEGIEGKWSALPKGVKPMKKKRCFENAFRTVTRYGLTYVEGYAVGIIPTHHAWCIDEAGNVVDPTWHEEEYSEVEYLGVAFDEDYVMDTVVETGTYGVFYSDDGFGPNMDLLKGKVELRK